MGSYERRKTLGENSGNRNKLCSSVNNDVSVWFIDGNKCTIQMQDVNTKGTGCGVYGSPLCYLHNACVNLNLFSIFKSI